MQPRTLTPAEEFSLLLIQRGVKEMSRDELEEAVTTLYEAYIRLTHLLGHS